MFGMKTREYGFPENIPRIERRRLVKALKTASRNERRFSFGESTYGVVHPWRVDDIGDSSALFGFEDESGDLGNKQGSSEYFASTVIVTDDPRYLDEIVARHPKNSRHLPGQGGELKFHNSTGPVRVRVLRDAISGDVRAYSVVYKKPVERWTGAHGIPLMDSTLSDAVALAAANEDGPLDMTFDQHRSLTKEMAERMCRNATARTSTEVNLLDYAGQSHKSGGLQMVDMFSGSLGNRYKSALPQDERDRYWRISRRRTELIER